MVLGGFLGEHVDSLLLFSKGGIWNEDFKSADCRVTPRADIAESLRGVKQTWPCCCSVSDA